MQHLQLIHFLLSICISHSPLPESFNDVSNFFKT